MKIYQVHRIEGKYEDYTDIIVGSYLQKERAKQERIKLENEYYELYKKSKRCMACKITSSPFISLFMTTYETDGVDPKNCPNADIVKTNGRAYCKNFCSYWDDVIFRIEEIEVEE